MHRERLDAGQGQSGHDDEKKQGGPFARPFWWPRWRRHRLPARSASSDFGPKTGIGAALGAAGGGLLGAAAGGGATGIAAGVLLGGLVGGATGSMLDDQDKRTAAATTQQALEDKPSGTTTTWKNPDSGNSGSVTPDPHLSDPPPGSIAASTSRR